MQSFLVLGSESVLEEANFAEYLEWFIWPIEIHFFDWKKVTDYGRIFLVNFRLKRERIAFNFFRSKNMKMFL